MVNVVTRSNSPDRCHFPCVFPESSSRVGVVASRGSRPSASKSVPDSSSPLNARENHAIVLAMRA